MLMRRKGLPIEGVGLGLPMPFVPMLKIKTDKLFFYISPVLIGAFVKPHESAMYRLREIGIGGQCEIAGAGIVANFLVGCLLVIVHNIYVGWSLLVIGAMLATMLLLIVGFRVICKYFLIPIGAASVAYVLWHLFASPDPTFGGFVAIYESVKSANVDTLERFLRMSYILSFGLGMLNCIPLRQVDGGQIVAAFMRESGWRRAETIYTLVSAALLVLTIFAALFADLELLIGKLVK